MTAAVLFDLDGTLLDSAPDFIHIINQMRQQRSLPPADPDFLRQYISGGAAAMIQAGLPEHCQDKPSQATLIQEFLQQYEAAPCRHSALFPGVADLLVKLEERSIPWGVVTNKHWRFAGPIAAALNWDTKTHPVICPDHLKTEKPHPEGLLLACNHLQADPAKSFYLGDHIRDITAGKNAGMKTIACSYGYLSDTDKPDHWQADFIISDSRALSALLAAELSG